MKFGTYFSVKQVEPIILAKRDKVAWTLLNDSNGTKLKLVVMMMNEKKEVRQAEDKVRYFISWLKEEKNLTLNAKTLLAELSNLAHARSR